MAFVTTPVQLRRWAEECRQRGDFHRASYHELLAILIERHRIGAIAKSCGVSFAPVDVRSLRGEPSKR